ncbi:protein kinase domain-containing protein [Mycolicibacterium frederiksbergense]|nr:transporter substrate-binding domain-containing protein [Mycolicibacterium frederiksbergense]
MQSLRQVSALALALIWILGIFVIASPISSASEDGDHYVIATDTTFAPFEYQDSSGSYVGIDMDLMRAIAADQGFTVDIKPLGFDASLQALQAYQVDGVIAGLSITDERKAVFDFSDPYFVSGVQMAVPNSNTDITEYQDLANRRVAVKDGTQGADFARSIATQYGFTVVGFPNSSAMFDDVRLGRTAALFEDSPVLQYGIAQGNGFKTVTPLEDPTDYGFAVAKDRDQDLLARFNAGLRSVRDSGKYTQIVDTYLKPPSDTTQSSPSNPRSDSSSTSGALIIAIAILCTLAAALGVYIWLRHRRHDDAHQRPDVTAEASSPAQAVAEGRSTHNSLPSSPSAPTQAAPAVLHPSEATVSAELGRYQLLDVIGRGGMGEVWKAFDTDTNRIVALKLLPPHLTDDRTFRERFKREARLAASLTEPHVLPIHHFGTINGRLYVDMRLVEGRDLASILADGPLSPKRSVIIIDQIASALDAAHQSGLIHRDVKPSNILVGQRDFAYLIDFGIARSANDTALTQTGHAVGTFFYMAPERLAGSDNLDHRVDVYALACVLHECLTGNRPFTGDSLERQVIGHLSTQPPKPSEFNPEVPTAFDSVVAAGMAKSLDERYASAPELADAAHHALST